MDVADGVVKCKGDEADVKRVVGCYCNWGRVPERVSGRSETGVVNLNGVHWGVGSKVFVAEAAVGCEPLVKGGLKRW